MQVFKSKPQAVRSALWVRVLSRKLTRDSQAALHHLPEGDLGCFQALGITNKKTVNTRMQTLFGHMCHLFGVLQTYCLISQALMAFPDILLLDLSN